LSQPGREISLAREATQFGFRDWLAGTFPSWPGFVPAIHVFRAEAQ